MSGMEVIGGLSAVISLLEAIVNLYGKTQNDITLSETFEAAGRQLPVLLHILQTYKAKLEPLKHSLPSEVCQALEKTLNDCEEKAQRLSEIFTTVLSGPKDTLSWRQRYSKIMRRLGQRNRVDLLMTAITEDIQLLANSEVIRAIMPNQNTTFEAIFNDIQHVHNSAPQEEKLAQSFHNNGAQNNNVNSGNGQLNTGNGQQINTHARVQTQTFNFVNTIPNDYFSFCRLLSISLDQAPPMLSGLFVGRKAGINAIRKALLSANEGGLGQQQQQQQRLALGGIGGIGKNLNAATEVTLKVNIFESQALRSLQGDEVVRITKEWLSGPKNSECLVVFDNYDDPVEFNLELKGWKVLAAHYEGQKTNMNQAQAVFIPGFIYINRIPPFPKAQFQLPVGFPTRVANIRPTYLPTETSVIGSPG
ncbi:hypothetical protein BJX76DRAFT_357977 [Aspergillus varians]